MPTPALNAKLRSTYAPTWLAKNVLSPLCRRCVKHGVHFLLRTTPIIFEIGGIIFGSGSAHLSRTRFCVLRRPEDYLFLPNFTLLHFYCFRRPWQVMPKSDRLSPKEVRRSTYIRNNAHTLGAALFPVFHSPQPPWLFLVKTVVKGDADSSKQYPRFEKKKRGSGGLNLWAGRGMGCIERCVLPSLSLSACVIDSGNT